LDDDSLATGFVRKFLLLEVYQSAKVLIALR